VLRKKQKLIVFLFIILAVIFLACTVVWLSGSYAIQKQKTIGGITRSIQLPDSTFERHSYSIDSIFRQRLPGRPLYWEIRSTAKKQLEKQSHNNKENNYDSIIVILPRDRIAKIFFLVSESEIIYAMSLSIFLALLLLSFLTLTGFISYRLFRKIKSFDDLKSDFFHNITHELKTPLSGIMATTELLKNFGYINYPEKKHQLLNRIEVEAERLHFLIQNIIDLSTLEQISQVKTENTDMGVLIERTIQRLCSRIEQTQATINHHVPAKPLLVNGDVHYLENLFIILLDNALKYGGHAVKISVHYELSKTCIYIMICDNGPGIPVAQQPFLFEKFFRVPGPQTKTIPGNGLGLYYAKKIMQLHQGHIKYIGNQQNCFRLEFPLTHG
jgi:signal transduction histidine kinase